MATLESIRKRSGLLIIVIGFAMLAFILTDLLSSGSIFTQDDLTSVGKVNGETIEINAFNAEIERLRNADPAYRNQSSTQLANLVWTEKLRNIILGKEYEDLGFTITSGELADEITNNQNISQMEAFIDPNTGRFDRGRFYSALSNLKQNASSSEQAMIEWQSWVKFENDIKAQSINFKYNDAIAGAMYVPKALAELNHSYEVISYDVQFVQIPYASIPDTAVQVEESDYKAYYNEHKHEFKQNFETRDIRFVNFPIVPSAQDSQLVFQELTRLIEPEIRYNSQTGMTDTLPGLRTTDDDSSFVMIHSSLPYRSEYTREGMLSGNIDSIMFAAEPGFVYGPYSEAGGYKISKLVDIKMLPDSVNARHILIAYQGATRSQATRTPVQAKVLADSLFALINEDITKFEGISDTYSDDLVSKADGGNLNWFTDGQMTAAFSNYCFTNEVGDIGLVPTEFGFHIIEILDQGGNSKGVQVATVFREVIPSRETESEIYDRASQFAAATRGADFADVAANMGLELKEMADVQSSLENIIGLGQARPVVTWAFGKEAEVAEKDVNLINNDNRGFVVAQLTSINPEGYKSLDRVREEIKPMVINKVKAEQLITKAHEAMNAGDIAAAASVLGLSPNTQRISLANSNMTGVGNEAAIVGRIAGTTAGTLSGPFEGKRGVYIYVVNNVGPFVKKDDYSSDIMSAKTELVNRVNNELFQAILNQSDIEDNRIRFF